jgi:hypothetical protein
MRVVPISAMIGSSKHICARCTAASEFYSMLANETRPAQEPPPIHLRYESHLKGLQMTLCGSAVSLPSGVGEALGRMTAPSALLEKPLKRLLQWTTRDWLRAISWAFRELATDRRLGRASPILSTHFSRAAGRVVATGRPLAPASIHAKSHGSLFANRKVLPVCATKNNLRIGAGEFAHVQVVGIANVPTALAAC